MPGPRPTSCAAYRERLGGLELAGATERQAAASRWMMGGFTIARLPLALLAKVDRPACRQ
jgi:hypothetical protein